MTAELRMKIKLDTEALFGFYNFSKNIGKFSAVWFCFPYIWTTYPRKCFPLLVPLLRTVKKLLALHDYEVGEMLQDKKRCKICQ